MKASDNPYPSVLLDEQGSDPSGLDAGTWRLYAKSDGLYVVDDADAVTGPFIPASSTGILAVTAYNPGGGATYNTTSRSFVAVDTTNLAVTFVAPPSGKVTLYLQCMIDCSAAPTDIVWRPYIHAGAAVGDSIHSVPSDAGRYPTAAGMCYITGLTPGASVTLDWYWLATANTGYMQMGNGQGQGLMIVTAAP